MGSGLQKISMTEVQFRKKQGQQSQKDPEYEVKKYGFFFCFYPRCNGEALKGGQSNIY